MMLSRMISAGREELICDLAETYHIYDMRSLSPERAAIFSCGLRNDSRIKMKLAELKYTISELLDVMIYDRLAWLCWAQTADARKGRNRPEPLLDILMDGGDKEDEVVTFDSPEEFEYARIAALKGVD